MNDEQAQEGRFGDIIQDFVNGIAHQGGQTLAIMNEASVTLQQVIFLKRISEVRIGTPSELTGMLGMSLPSVSQMIDRLYRLGLLVRTEHSSDRRKKEIALTEAGAALLTRLYEARSIEFEAGAARLSPELRSDLERLLRMALLQLNISISPRRQMGAESAPFRAPQSPVRIRSTSSPTVGTKPLA